VGHPKIISTQISEQKILMRFLFHNIPKQNKLAEKISQKNTKNRNFFNCSYMAMSSLTYIPGFSVKFFFQLIYTDYAN
jgi:hypothetical protein